MKLTAVSTGVVSQAYINFMNVYSLEPGSGFQFWAFLGLEVAPSIDSDVHNWMLPEQAARYVQMLAGPHFHAVAKAMVATGHQYEVPAANTPTSIRCP